MLFRQKECGQKILLRENTRAPPRSRVGPGAGFRKARRPAKAESPGGESRGFSLESASMENVFSARQRRIVEMVPRSFRTCVSSLGSLLEDGRAGEVGAGAFQEDVSIAEAGSKDLPPPPMRPSPLWHPCRARLSLRVATTASASHHGLARSAAHIYPTERPCHSLKRRHPPPARICPAGHVLDFPWPGAEGAFSSRGRPAASLRSSNAIFFDADKEPF